MNSLGVPVQVVMEPDFLGYMQTATPSFQTSTFVPNTGDRTLNTANTAAIYDAGLLTAGVGPAFDNTVAGLVQAINYYTATKTPNLRIGWKTNIWSVADQQNWSLGLLHMTDSTTYPGRGNGHARPDLGRGAHLHRQSSRRARWIPQESRRDIVGGVRRPDAVPAIDKYGGRRRLHLRPGLPGHRIGNRGVRQPRHLHPGRLPKPGGHIRCRHPEVLRPVKIRVRSLLHEVQRGLPRAQSDVQAVFTTLQNAAKADPNMALWFFNADQWNNYLLLVSSLSQALDGTKVMLWQIPQGHQRFDHAARNRPVQHRRQL